jgi:formylglycine-generating enzyme required for sulfatase activity
VLRGAAGIAGAGGMLLAGCADAASRPQVLLYLDLDLPVNSQIGSAVSADAAIDTLRVEIFDSTRRLLDDRTLFVRSTADLPLSIGVPSEVGADGRVLVRIRAYQALFATFGEQAGAPALDPMPEVTVDRLVTLALPTEGTEIRSVTLHGDCMGLPAHFGILGQPDRTCIDAEHMDATSGEGIAPAPAGPSVAGIWSLAAVRPCDAEAPTGVRCIPGGLTILGEPSSGGEDVEYDTVPLRVVVLDPFYLDETEVTVGQLRALEAQGYAGPWPEAPVPNDPNSGFCTWDPGSDVDLPLNCFAPETADAICTAKHGAVPSEAQWEHAARGRGQRRIYPWGNRTPDCCAASIARALGGGCPISGPESVGSHAPGAQCAGRRSTSAFSDTSRDGVLDMAGSVSELVRDSVARFDDPCWASPGASAILDNPVCFSGTDRMARGGAFAMPFADAAVFLRRPFVASDSLYGFRCAYPSE